MAIGKRREKPIHFLGVHDAGHDGLLIEGCEIVDGKSQAGFQLGPRGADQHQGAGEPFAVARQDLFLQRQHRLQRVRPRQKLADPGQGQAQALESQDLVQAGDLVRAIGRQPACGPQRLEQTVLLIQAQRLDADAEAPGGSLGLRWALGVTLLM